MNEPSLNQPRKMSDLLRCNNYMRCGDRMWRRPLDERVTVRKAPLAMNFRTLPIAAIALIALSACNNTQKAQEVTSVADDPNAAAVRNAAPVELPPAITADVTMRCKDNSLVYVTFFTGDKQAVVKTAKDGPSTMLTAA